MNSLTIDQINQIDLVDFLAAIGIQPTKRKAWRYYYHSPLCHHPAKRPSFIVNKHLNSWRETTTKETGKLADLAVRMYDCTIGELNAKLRAALPIVPQQPSAIGPKTQTSISVEEVHPIKTSHLCRFLWERRIPLNVARLFCFEVWYRRGTGIYSALAFRNDAGGFELADGYRRLRAAPSDISLIKSQSTTLAIFGHFSDFLSFATIFSGSTTDLPDVLVLNAPVSFQAVRPIIEPYHQIHLFLPNDAPGIAFSKLATAALPTCADHRPIYGGYLSLNDWVCRIGKPPVSKTCNNETGGWAKYGPNRPQNASTPERRQDD